VTEHLKLFKRKLYRLYFCCKSSNGTACWSRTGDHCGVIPKWGR